MPIPLVIESWIWYGFATVVALLRFIARYINFGSIKQLQIDDLLMAIAVCFYTTSIVAMNVVADKNTNLFPDGWFQTHQLTPPEINEREFGSKIVIVVEQCQIATIWLIKACLLIMYHRITLNSFRAQNIAVKILAAYVLFGFVFLEIFYFGVWCRPFSNMWAVPTPNPRQCAAAINHLICNAVFNLTSDLAMLCIAIPMFARSNLPMQRKLVLCGVFGFGIFVIVSAVLNKFYSFAHPFGNQWTYWYIRESSTAMIVANIPFTWTLIRRVCGAKSFFGQQRTGDSKVETRMTGDGVRLDSTKENAKRKVHALFGHSHSSDSDDKDMHERESEASDRPANSQEEPLRQFASQTPSSQRPILARGESNSTITGPSTSILGREEQLALGSWDFGAEDDILAPSLRRPLSSSMSRRETDASVKQVYVPFRERRQNSAHGTTGTEQTSESQTSQTITPIPETCAAGPESAMEFLTVPSEFAAGEAARDPPRRHDDSPV